MSVKYLSLPLSVVLGISGWAFAGNMYIVDADRSPAAVLELVNDTLSVKRHTYSGGAISAFAFSSAPVMTLIPADGKSIVSADGQNEVTIYSSGSRMSDIAFDEDNDLFFSVADGGTQDGQIYLLDFKKNTFQIKQMPVFYQVRLSEVDGYWDGHFTVRPRTGDLYLCTGRRTPASIYVVSRPPGDIFGKGPARKVFTSVDHPICNVAFDDSGHLFYTDDRNRVYSIEGDRSRLFKTLTG